MKLKSTVHSVSIVHTHFPLKQALKLLYTSNRKALYKNRVSVGMPQKAQKQASHIQRNAPTSLFTLLYIPTENELGM